MQLEKVKLSVNYTNLTGKLLTTIDGKDTSYHNLYRKPNQILNLQVSINATKKLFIAFSNKFVSKRFEAVYLSAPIQMPANSV
jgi:vitamin B12 transporter